MNKIVYDEKLKSFGKTILFTDNHEWSIEQIIEFYRGKSEIEKDFKIVFFNDMNDEQKAMFGVHDLMQYKNWKTMRGEKGAV